MNKKILIGSIIAVAILIGIPFTSVVGYQSTSRTIAEASPLFTVRSSRAIDEESKDLTYNYVGKGEETKIQLPERYAPTELVNNLINLIRMMDDKSLQRFAYLITYYINKNDVTLELNYKDVFLASKQIRESPERIIQNILDKRDPKVLTNICSIYLTCNGGPLECFILNIILEMAFIIGIFIITPILLVISRIIYFIRETLTISKPECPNP